MQSIDHVETLKKQWQNIYNSKDSKLILRGNIQGVKIKKIDNHYIILNKSYAQKRQSTIPHNQKSVFLNFNPDKFNFTKVSNKQILFYINLDQEEIITKQNAYKLTQKYFEQQQQQQIQGHAHPVLIHIAPLCKYHCILSMYPDQQLPQIVGSDIMLLLLNIFKILPGIKIGYNSIGGAATVNHLHFHLILSRQLIGQQKFPIEFFPRKLWLKSSLINPQQQINLYSVGVIIQQISTQNLFCFVISPIKPKQQQLDFSQTANSLSFTFGILVNQLIELSIPHNILISDNGMTIYIFTRDFSKQKYGWLQFCGIQITTQDQDFQNSTSQNFNLRIKQLLIDNKLIDLVKNNVKKNLSKFI